MFIRIFQNSFCITLILVFYRICFLVQHEPEDLVNKFIKDVYYKEELSAKSNFHFYFKDVDIKIANTIPQYEIEDFGEQIF